MSANPRTLLIFGALLVIPAGLAVAQTSPAGQAGMPAAGSQMTMTAAGTQANGPTNFDTPGATGRTIVRGSHSTIDGDEAATEDQRTGSIVPSD